MYEQETFIFIHMDKDVYVLIIIQLKTLKHNCLKEKMESILMALYKWTNSGKPLRLMHHLDKN